MARARSATPVGRRAGVAKLTSEATQVALIGLLGAILGALLVAFLQPIWAIWLNPKSRLAVKITHNSFKIPVHLRNSIDQYTYNYHLKIRPTDAEKEKRRTIKNCNGLSSIELNNLSKRTITSISIRDSGGSVIMVDHSIDGERKDTFFGKNFDIEKLKPRSVVKAEIWTSRDYADNSWSEPRDQIIVTASEYDRIRTNVSYHSYIKSKNFIVRRRYFWYAFWIILVIYWTPLAIDAIFKSKT
jgi:hypothetical protein